MKLNVVCIIEMKNINLNVFVFLVENMAYKKQTWTNDQNRQYKKNSIDGLLFRSTRETNGDPSLAVDGFEEPLEWSKCATIDNYFVEKPIWMVDLGRKKNIAGVMLRTWGK